MNRVNYTGLKKRVYLRMRCVALVEAGGGVNEYPEPVLLLEYRRRAIRN
jgi:hypothetical protein